MNLKLIACLSWTGSLEHRYGRCVGNKDKNTIYDLFVLPYTKMNIIFVLYLDQI
jgi:hypothetical protein